MTLVMAAFRLVRQALAHAHGSVHLNGTETALMLGVTPLLSLVKRSAERERERREIKTSDKNCGVKIPV